MSAYIMSLNIPADHPAYTGHFPGHPILPGVVLLDAALNALATHQGLPTTTGQLKSAKFLSPVQPGEALLLHASKTAAGGFRFDIRCGERAVASGVVEFAQEVPA
jgi:3-hydroxymyristoyl/3-hydroxydecanoyl-(acyl carrier protein) dehydratase